MMKKRKRTILIILLMVIVLAVVVGSVLTYTYNHKLPSAADDALTRYMEAFKNGTKDASQYAHFKNEEVRETYEGAGTVLYDYRIEKITRINDKLFALTVLVKTNRTDEAYMRVYNFVGYINDSWIFINGVGNIPEEICYNLNREAYMYR